MKLLFQRKILERNQILYHPWRNRMREVWKELSPRIRRRGGRETEVDFGIFLLFGGYRRSSLLQRGFLRGLHMLNWGFVEDGGTFGRGGVWVWDLGDFEFLGTLYASQTTQFGGSTLMYSVIWIPFIFD